MSEVKPPISPQAKGKLSILNRTHLSPIPIIFCISVWLVGMGVGFALIELITR